MKQKSKTILLAILFVALVASLLAFAACDLFPMPEPHTHSYTEQVVNPTCTEQGYTLHKCSCGDEYKDTFVDAIGHNYSTEFEIDFEPTCVKAGEKSKHCLNGCGSSIEVTLIDALGHDLSHYDAQTVTCTEIGWDEYDVCSRCDYNTYLEIPALGHDTGEWVIDIEATCEIAGSKHTECNVCHATVETAVIDALGHDWSYTFDDTQHWAICNNCKSDFNEKHIWNDNDCPTCGYDAGGLKGLLWSMDADENYVVAGIGSVTDVDIVIPSKHNGKSVVGIEDYAFQNCSNLHSVVLEDGMTDIGVSAFNYCTNLTSITIGSGITNIDDEAFYQCSSLTTVNISNSVVSIGDRVFSGCRSLESIAIPNNVTNFGSEAFFDCSNLSRVNYWGTLSEWCGITFSGNTANPLCNGANLYFNNQLLTELEIPNTIDEVKSFAFVGCTSITKVIIADDVSIGDNILFDCCNIENATIPTVVLDYFPKEKLKTLVITSGSEIGKDAFWYCNNLTSIILSNSVNNVGSYAFYHCSSLESVTLGSGKLSIGERAFEGCDKLVKVNYNGTLADWCNINFDGGYANPLCYSHNLYINDTCVTNGKLAIPDNVTKILPYAFWDCTDITSIIISNSVTTIGEYAFYNCGLLNKVIISDSMSSIDESAFANCTIENVSMPTSVISYVPKYNLKTVIITSGNTIENFSFSGCNFLESVTINYGVQAIGEGAFYNCKNLTSIEIPDSIKSIGYNAFMDCQIEQASLPTSAIAYIPKTDLKTVIITGGESIAAEDFRNCGNLASITIPRSVTSIGEYAFYNCNKLTKINYTGSIADWCNINFGGSYVSPFYCDYNLYLNDELVTELEIPDTVTEIKNFAFAGCASITSAKIPNSVTNIGCFVFYNCSSLAKVNYLGTIADWCNICFGDMYANPLYCAHNLYLNDEPVTELIIPDTVSEIKDFTFVGFTSITSVTIPNSIKNIGNDAFSGCSNLINVVVGNKVESIGNYAFSHCSKLINVTLPNSAINIGRNAFNSCSSLESIVIPDSVQVIGDYAFYFCSKLTSVTIGNGVVSIGEDAFSYCNNIEQATIPTLAISYIPKYSLKTVAITSGDSIGDRAFSWRSNLISVTLSDSVTSIGKEAFLDCENLKYNEYDNALYLGNETNPYLWLMKVKDTNITSCVINLNTLHIYDGAFNDCNDIEQAIIPAFAISYMPKTSLKSVTITNGDSIEANAFSECSVLVNVTIPDSVTSIGEGAFDGCNNIEQAIIPSFAIAYLPKTNLKTVIITSGTSIKENAFEGCTNLTDVTIPEGVTSIGERAFYSCNSLTTVTLPSSVISVGSRAFDVAWNIVKVNYLGTISDWCNINFVDGDSSPFSPFNRTSLYLNDEKVIELIIPNTVTEIKDYTFLGSTGITKVTIPNSVTSIGNNSFSRCVSIKSITIPNSVISIGERAFYGCSSLEEVLLPESITSIGSGMFYNCTNLAYVTIPNSVTSIGERAFYGCSKLTNVVIPDSVTEIGSRAFSNCENLTNVTIGNGLVHEIFDVFYNCNNIEYASIPTLAISCIPKTNLKIVEITSGEEIGSSRFSDSSNLISVKICKSVTNVGMNAFKNCSNLTSLFYTGTIADWCKISFSDQYANPLYYAHNLYIDNELITELEIPDTVTEIKSYVFYGCTSITSVTIPKSVTSIGDYAFYVCNRLVEVYNLSILTITAGSNNNGYVAAYAKDVYTSLDEQSKIATTAGGFVFYDDGNAVYLINYVGDETEIVLPDTFNGKTYVIDRNAFRNCNVIKSINIPESVTSIGEGAFYGCSKLINVVLPDSVELIGRWAFDNCTSLEYNEYDNALYLGNDANPYLWLIRAKDTNITSCVINSNTKYIYSDAFNNCSFLTSVTISSNVISIGEFAFSSCYRLVEVYNLSNLVITAGSWGNGYVAHYAKDVYTSLDEESKLTTTNDGYVFYEDGNNVYLVNYIGSAVELVLPNTFSGKLYAIDQYAFYNCNELTNVIIGDGITSIGYKAFGNCDKIVSITIGNNVTSIDRNAFDYCSSLKYNEYDNALYLGDDTNPYLWLIKAKDRYIKSCVINSNTKYIYYNAFSQCGELTSITMPEGLIAIWAHAFQICTNLTDVVIPNSVIIIDEGVFSSCSSLTSITIPNSVTSINYGVFNNCSSLNSVVIPTSVTKISFGAFDKCSALQSVYYEGTVEQWATISIDSSNSILDSVTRYYYSETEPELNDEGTAYSDNYWHYDDNGEIVIWTYSGETN